MREWLTPAPVGVHGLPPTVTVPDVEKLLPSNVMLVIPMVDPDDGETDVMEGALYEKVCEADLKADPTEMMMGRPVLRPAGTVHCTPVCE